MRVEFHPRDFPHGLVCGECGKPIVSGFFETRLTEESAKEVELQPVAWEGYIPVSIVICERCDGDDDTREPVERVIDLMAALKESLAKHKPTGDTKNG
jgi:hypothetical protein